MSIQTESRQALRELIALLQEADERWAGPEWNLASAEDVAGAHRALMHMLEGGLVGMFESDPAHPQFRRIVTPSRKFTGDNADAIYFDAPVSADHVYTVRGNMDGAVYVSITLEIGTADGSLGSQTAGVINDTMFDVDAAGNFAIRLGGAPAARNWLALPAGVSRITTRHYYEEAQTAADDPARGPRLSITADDVSAPPAPAGDADVAAGIRRVAQFVRSRTLLQPPMTQREPPSFLSLVPNQFVAPVPPGDMGLAAFDAYYSMAPFFLGPDQALVMTGRWPDCRFANVSLWNRFQQTLDYANRSVSLNRRQTRLETDGTFRMVLAHRDPGCPNWLDTEGQAFGLVFWRYFLPAGPVQTPRAEVVPFTSLR
ncbi:MAG: DUF1214 domain-containing protein [Pseudomonadales bacterium]|nr:DUF1214 domain-containing protein [Pseudomonadales bacterium]MBP9032274.1 DUF1214 domain-containing protein [Pseudomonadales bacterium]